MTEPLIFETVEPGEIVGPFDYRIPDNFNAKRVSAIGTASREDYLSPDGREIAEPSILCGQHSWTLRKRFNWSGSVHAKCEAEFLRPLYVGTGISVTSRIVEKYERRGGKYIVFLLETRDETGEPIARVRNTMLLNYAEVAANRTPKSGDAKELEPAEDARPSVDLVVGHKTFQREEMISFFECEEEIYGPLPSMHNTPERAAKLGMPDIAAPGRYAIGLFSGGLVRALGTGWISGARFAVAIRNNLLPGARFVATAQLKETQYAESAAGRRIFTLDCRDTAADKPLVSGTFEMLSPDGKLVAR